MFKKFFFLYNWKLSKKGDRELFLETLEKISTFSNYNIDYQDENGYSAIHYCCIEGNLKIVEILLSKLWL